MSCCTRQEAVKYSILALLDLKVHHGNRGFQWSDDVYMGKSSLVLDT